MANELVEDAGVQALCTHDSSSALGGGYSEATLGYRETVINAKTTQSVKISVPAVPYGAT